MNRRLCRKGVAVAALFLSVALLVHPARGGAIDGYNGATGGGTATVNGQYYGPIDTYFPNDAAQGGAGGVSPNVLTVNKNFTSLDPIDMSFHVVDSGGYTSYLFDETVTNSTGFNWTDYHFELGFGVGNAFVLAAAPSELTFDSTNPATTDSFSNGIQTDYTVNWNGPPGIPNGGTGSFTVQIIVPDTALANSPYSMAGDTAYDFTLHQYPTVPEPSSVMLLGAGIAGLAVLRRRRSR